jgi:hypothetical protein
MKDNDKETVTIQDMYEKLSHPFCGTPKCCGKCSMATKIDGNVENIVIKVEENKDKEGLA